MANKNIFLFLFPIVALVFIIANQTGLLLLSYASKPLMILTLSIFFYLSVKGKFNTFAIYILLALLSSTFGDGLVVRGQGDVLSPYFMWGLTCFFISHVFYTFAFVVAPVKKRNGYLQRKPGWIVLFITIQIVTLVFLWPDIPGNLRIPITIRSQAMVFMVLAMCNLKNQISQKAFSSIALGTTLYILSDVLISIIRFKVDQVYVPQPRLAIVLTYLSGHYFLMIGSLRILNYLKGN